jgi:gamma-glutamyltranspeptidase
VTQTYVAWIDREYVWGAGDVDELILQIDQVGTQLYALTDGQLNVVGGVAPDVLTALEGLGPGVERWPAWEWRAGAVSAIVVGPGGTLMAGADPRRGSHAIGW